MSIKIELPNNIVKIDRQIKALKSIIPKDSQKDRTIHKQALKQLQKHREQLLKGEK